MHSQERREKYTPGAQKQNNDFAGKKFLLTYEKFLVRLEVKVVTALLTFRSDDRADTEQFCSVAIMFYIILFAQVAPV